MWIRPSFDSVHQPNHKTIHWPVTNGGVTSALPMNLQDCAAKPPAVGTHAEIACKLLSCGDKCPQSDRKLTMQAELWFANDPSFGVLQKTLHSPFHSRVWDTVSSVRRCHDCSPFASLSAPYASRVHGWYQDLQIYHPRTSIQLHHVYLADTRQAVVTRVEVTLAGSAVCLVSGISQPPKK